MRSVTRPDLAHCTVVNELRFGRQTCGCLSSASREWLVAYPWFGDWSRDTMTSYEGLFLETGREEEGRALLESAAASLSAGMLANRADVGGTEYNTVHAAMWFLHAVDRHVAVTDDLELGAKLVHALQGIATHHVKAGTSFPALPDHGS